LSSPAVLLASASGDAARQVPPGVPRALAGTWRLVSLERADGNQSLAAVPNPIGILIQDAKGNAVEIVTRSAACNSAGSWLSEGDPT
jgi:hypothetical protein